MIDLKSKPKEEEDSTSKSPLITNTLQQSSPLIARDFDWNIANEYDPMWPNDYEKVAKGM